MKTRLTHRSKISAGLVLCRIRANTLQVLLAHPGGPYWNSRDEGAWSIPKGEPGTREDLLETAKREFREETGIHPAGPFIELKPTKQKGGKVVHAWAFMGACDPTAIQCNTFKLEWPPHSGKIQSYPEIDRAAFFDMAEARRKINPGQVPLLDDLESKTAWIDYRPQNPRT